MSSSPRRLEKIGDLDGDGVSEAVLKWEGPAAPAGISGDNEASATPPEFYLLSWNGSEWLASKLLSTDQSVLIETLSAESAGLKALVVIVVQGATQISYPIIFRIQAHVATLEWDGRSDQSYYQGLPFSEVTFHQAGGAEFPDMIVSGEADPGLLVFPKDPTGRRGFRAQMVYAWQESAYRPVKTEYSRDPDFTLYSFIAALHRHDFKSAYALVEPRAFIETGKLSVDRFRQRIEKGWPEFLDDQIFDAVSDAGEPLPGYTFELRNEDKVKATYQPEFGPGPKFLLTGLKRTTPEGTDP